MAVLTIPASNCSEVSSDVSYAYSHLKKAYNSNNVDHLKHYAERSISALLRSVEILNDCGCESALANAKKGLYLLNRIATTETFEDGRFYVKRARPIAKEVIIALDYCTARDPEISLQSAHLTTEQAQHIPEPEQIKKQGEIPKSQLEAAENARAKLQNEHLISNLEGLIMKNLNTHNETLKSYNCKPISEKLYKSNASLPDSERAIKLYYKNILEKLSKEYLSALDSCIEK